MNYLLFTVKILNLLILKFIQKWGGVIFESNNINKCWDGFYLGEKVKQDKYLFKIDLTGEDNIPFSKSGLINVIY